MNVTDYLLSNPAAIGWDHLWAATQQQQIENADACPDQDSDVTGTSCYACLGEWADAFNQAGSMAIDYARIGQDDVPDQPTADMERAQTYFEIAARLAICGVKLVGISMIIQRANDNTYDSDDLLNAAELEAIERGHGWASDYAAGLTRNEVTS